MGIAVLGSVLFAIYLLVNFVVASTNERRIVELQQSKFLVLQELVSLRNEVDREFNSQVQHSFKPQLLSLHKLPAAV
jgi:hypothetical protein